LDAEVEEWLLPLGARTLRVVEVRYDDEPPSWALRTGPDELAFSIGKSSPELAVE
jgi:hypothetical protein